MASSLGWDCPECGDTVLYRIRNGKCIPCHDREYREYVANGGTASQWVADHEESAANEDYADMRKWKL
jgi:hypothetical protein